MSVAFTGTSTPVWEPWHAEAACPDSNLADLFTVDDPTELEKAAMGVVCNSCPVRTVCELRVMESNPGCGFWAGRFLGGEIPQVLMEKPRHRPVVVAEMGAVVDWRDSISTKHLVPVLRLVPALPPEAVAPAKAS